MFQLIILFRFLSAGCTTLKKVISLLLLLIFLHFEQISWSLFAFILWLIFLRFLIIPVFELLPHFAITQVQLVLFGVLTEPTSSLHLSIFISFYQVSCRRLLILILLALTFWYIFATYFIGWVRIDCWGFVGVRLWVQVLLQSVVIIGGFWLFPPFLYGPKTQEHQPTQANTGSYNRHDHSNNPHIMPTTPTYNIQSKQHHHDNIEYQYNFHENTDIISDLVVEWLVEKQAYHD